MKEGSATYKQHELLIAEARKYKAEGHSHDEVAAKFGKSKAWSLAWCKGIAPQGDRPVKNQRNQYTNGKFDRIANARHIIAKHYPNFEYVSGFVDVDSPVVIRCKVCGTERTASMVSLRRDGVVVCKECARRAREQKQASERASLLMQRNARSFNSGKQIALKFCACGAPIPAINKRCNDCARNLEHRRWNAKKDKRRKAAFTKESSVISLAALYERDHGICHICGTLCDITADPNSNSYPSIDHVLPISKGGKDKWDNVMLAHRLCNSLRGNREYI